MTVHRSSTASMSSAATRMPLPPQQQQQQVLRSWSSVATTVTTSTPELFETPHGTISREELDRLAGQIPRPLRLMDMYDYGRVGSGMQRLINAQFLYQELPVRIAQRVVDLLTLPHGLSEAKPIRDVAAIYLDYLARLRTIPLPTNQAEEERFTDILLTFILDRSTIPKKISEGVQIWAMENENNREMEKALYRFFTARVGLRFLVEHFILSSPRASCQSIRPIISMFPDEDYKGCIDNKCDVLHEITRVAKLVEQQTIDYYGTSPKIHIVDCFSGSRHAESDFTHIPHHLHYMFAELLQNSCRATVSLWHQQQQQSQQPGGSLTSTTKDTTKPLPPIRVIVSKGSEDVTVKIADTAGGIPRSQMDTIFRFAESSAKTDNKFATEVTPRGFGLPLARIYARYFGGELTLKSTEGYGLDAYLHMPRLGSATENLPLRVRESPGATDSSVRPPTTTTTSSSTRRK
jgi:pyruvate dehydrogenase kinase 2/3/4